MNLFNLGNGIYCIQCGVFLTKFGHRLLLSLSSQPDNVCKSWKNDCYDALSALYIKVTSDPVTFFNNYAYFSDFCAKIPFDLFNLNPF